MKISEKQLMFLIKIAQDSLKSSSYQGLFGMEHSVAKFKIDEIVNQQSEKIVEVTDGSIEVSS